MDIDSIIDQWSQTPEAQPYLQRAAQNLGFPLQMGSGQSGYTNPTMDQYGLSLLNLISSNASNPGLQEDLLGYYLDYTNPFNQAKLEEDNSDKINAAISLMSSDDENIKNIGLTLLMGAFPELNTTNQTGYGGIPSIGPNGIPQTYADVERERALKALQDYESLNEEQFNWNKYLATQATPEQINAYTSYDPTTREVLNEISATSGTNIFDKIAALVGLGDVEEEMRRRAAGYSGYSL